jgi:glycosyltransferase involved in cell wall biosynthesis
MRREEQEIAEENRRPSVGFVSTYPPTSCGLATFTEALRGAMADIRGSSAGLDVVSLVDGAPDSPSPDVVHHLVRGDSGSLGRAITLLNRHDIALVQHEYGIYGGPDGSDAVELVSRIEAPVIVTLHTVLGHPTRRQKWILEALANLADCAVVMSDSGYQRFVEGYDVEPSKVMVIPHGARAIPPTPRRLGDSRPSALTWGLIGPGKGLDAAIEAFGGLVDLRPRPRYRILGTTHPKVRATQGESYLERLAGKVEALDLGGIVEFDNRYLGVDALAKEIAEADLVVIPYESTQQVTSGVLVEALAAGKPVVATAFPQAVEVLSTGAGVVVPHSDVDALASALRRLLTHPDLLVEMSAKARAVGAAFSWPVVAGAYERVISRLSSQGGRLTAIA